jgi:Uri superfamily endonuclease
LKKADNHTPVPSNAAFIDGRIVLAPKDRLYYLGGDSRGGTYILRMHVSELMEKPFGRFKCGKIISVVPGEYCYVGSALSEKGATCLAKRLVRHASRLGNNPVHSIRRAMLTEFPRYGLADCDLEPKNPKKPKWNVDHLLDEACVELVAAYLIRSPERIEFDVADWLVADPATVVFEPGLGANDHAGGTHLMRVEADEDWWEQFPVRLIQRYLKGKVR